jgi:hypothetical protein
MKNFCIGFVVLLIVIASLVFYFGNTRGVSYQTYAECVVRTELPCRFYFIYDMGREWRPSTFKTKAECDANEGVASAICIVPDGNFKEVRWISSVDWERAKEEKYNPISQ